jgi:hypothetical protein
MADDVDIRVRLRGQREVLAGTKQVAGGIKGIGTQAKRTTGHVSGTTRKLGLMSRATGRLSGETKGLAKNLVAIGAGYVGITAAKSAIDVTTDLAKSTIGLNRNLGFSIDLASRWAAVARARGVDGKELNSAFTSIAKSAKAAHDPTSAQASAFREVGISAGELKRGAKDFPFLLTKLADGFGGMAGGTRRAALAQALLGRSSQTTLPIFTSGSKAMKEQLDLAKKYGVTFGGKPIKSLKDLVQAQKEAEFATMGLQVAFGTFAAPLLTKGLGHVNKFVAEMQAGKGAGGEFVDTLEGIGQAITPTLTTIGSLAKGTAQFAKEHPNITKAAIALLAVGRAVTLIKTSKAISGLATLATTTRKVIKSSAKRGAIAGADVAAETLVHNTGVGVQARRGRLNGTMSKVGRGVGGVFGVAAAAEAGHIFYSEIDRIIRDLEHSGKPAVSAYGTALKVVTHLGPFQAGRIGKFGYDKLFGGGDKKGPKKPKAAAGWRVPPKPTGPRDPIGGRAPRRPRARAPKLATPTIVPRTAPVFAGAAAGDTTIVVPVELDGRVIAEVVAVHVRNRGNRR